MTLTRRALLRLAPVAAVAPLLAPLAKPALDPRLAAILDAGGKVHRYAREHMRNGWTHYVTERGGGVVGFISERGRFEMVTTSWPTWR